MIIPWLLDPQLFDSEYLSNNDEALELLLEISRSFTIWPLAENVRVKIYQQLDELINNSRNQVLKSRAEGLKKTLSEYISRTAVFLPHSFQTTKVSDEINLKLLQDFNSITALVTTSNKLESLKSKCNVDRKDHICSISNLRGTPLLMNFIFLAKGAVPDPNPATYNKTLFPVCFWASRLTIIDRYIGKSFTDYFEAKPNDEKMKIQWKRCRQVILSLHEMWSKGAAYIDKTTFNLITFYEPTDKSKKDTLFDLKVKDAKEVVEQMFQDLGISGNKFSICMKEIKNRDDGHDRYIVLEDNVLAIGISGGISKLRKDGHSTIDLYRRDPTGKNDKISRILKNASLAEIYGQHRHLTKNRTQKPHPGKFKNDGLSMLDEAFR